MDTFVGNLIWNICSVHLDSFMQNGFDVKQTLQKSYLVKSTLHWVRPSIIRSDLCSKKINYEKARAVPNLDKELHQNGMWNNRLHPVLEYGMRPREFLPSLQKLIWGQWKLRNRFKRMEPDAESDL